MHAYGICRYTQGAANQKQTNITINLHNYTFEYSFTYKTDGTTDANTTGVCKYNAHILKTNDFQFTLSQSLDDGYSAPSSFDLNSNISLTYCANSKEFGLKLAVFSDGIDEFSYIFIPANC
ncbi:hypothetical protein FACS1894166_05150 [Bacilli bacterium]|nr:hypothetical protein FACS1894166_05150 [Bacilli bacterium]